MVISAVHLSLAKMSGKWIGLEGVLESRRQRRAVARLTPRQLSDIGVNPRQAANEAGGPLWDAPVHRHG